jgi:hypothetical protein
LNLTFDIGHQHAGYTDLAILTATNVSTLINPIYPELSPLLNTAFSFAVQLTCAQVFLGRKQSIAVVAHDSIHQAGGPISSTQMIISRFLTKSSVILYKCWAPFT